MIYIYIGLAGFLGAIFRVSIGQLLFMLFPNILFPYPTLIINLIGSYILAFFLISIDNRRFEFSPELKIMISTGFLGSFTTFSTFSAETLHLFQLKAYGIAIAYIIASFIGGFLFTWMGIKSASRKKNLQKVSSKVRGNES